VQTRWYTQAERHSHGSAVRLESGDATIAIQPRVADLAEAADRVRVEARFSRGSSRARAGTQVRRTPMRSDNRVAWTGERRRWERDLHDGVQSELVSLLLRLQLAEDASPTPAAVTDTLAALTEHALAALESLREITYGIYPRALAKRGVRDTLLARAARATSDVTVHGSAPRSSEEAEEAIYFACSEAIQNAIKHAGDGARVIVALHSRDGSLTVRVADDGRGFDPAHTAHGAGLQNIRERVRDLGGSFELTSAPSRGTVLRIVLGWPPRAER
jgi:signal transduction histidine kinase